MNQKVSWLASILLVISYGVFSIIAVAHFPGSFSPLNNWLSDLGSNELNPTGAIFYNIGIISGGFFSVVFFLGFSTWLKKDKKIQNVMVYLAQIFGVLGGISMILSAIFPITAKEIHSFLSATLYIFLGTAFTFVVFALRYYSRFPKWLLAIGIFTVVVKYCLERYFKHVSFGMGHCWLVPRVYSANRVRDKKQTQVYRLVFLSSNRPGKELSWKANLFSLPAVYIT